MGAMEVGQKLVALCQRGKNLEALDTLYDKDVVSVEAMAMPDMPAEMKGVAALKKKNEWWFANNEVHGGSASATGPAATRRPRTCEGPRVVHRFRSRTLRPRTRPFRPRNRPACPSQQGQEPGRAIG